jgi:hypothetical protein
LHRCRSDKIFGRGPLSPVFDKDLEIGDDWREMIYPSALLLNASTSLIDAAGDGFDCMTGKNIKRIFSFFFKKLLTR